MTATRTNGIDVNVLKAHATGRWIDAIASICGIDRSILDGNHHPCPKCGGNDRFRVVDEAAGSLFCNQCFFEKNGDGIAAVMWLMGRTFPEALSLVADHLRIEPRPTTNGKPHANGKPVAKFDSPQLAANWLANKFGVPLAKWWEYKNERGNLVTIQTRFNLANGEKEFRPISRHPKGGVAIKAPDGLRPLYRLPEILVAETVYICEGEKAADAAVSLGLTATTSLNGAKSPKKTNWKPLKGRHVIILPDHDKPGRDFAETVAKLCREAGVASVKILELPGLNEGDDIVEWIENHGNGAEPDAMRQELESLAVAQIPPSEMPVDWMSPHTIQGRTDLANGKRFANLMSDSARYCHPWNKWLVWDGTRWKIDDCGAVLQLAKAIPESIWKEAMATPGLSDDAVRFAAVSASQRSLNAAIALAASEPGMSILPQQLDSDPWALNCINGTVDLRTGELRPHRREDHITKLCPTPFDPEADSYIWDRFLDDVFDGREPLIKFVQRAFGYSISGDVREHILLIFYGKGANGKSSAVDAVMNAIGPDYSMQSPPSLIVERRGESHPTELAALFGKRLVIASETEQTAKLAEGLIKQLTGGDAISARRMREDFWTFQPTHKLILATNHRPKVKGTDHGIWRRLRLVPFTQTFDGERKDASLKGRLLSIPSGILAWLVRGCLEWQCEGLGSADEVDAATTGYRSEQDVIGRFISDCCLKGSPYRIKFSALYAALERWADETGDNLPSRKMLGEWLVTNDFEPKRSGGMWYLGITTKPDLDAESDETRDPFSET